MGIFINLKIIPSRIMPEKWRSVYQETLQLVEAYDFMDKIAVRRNGLQYEYSTGTVERENLLETGFCGWHSVGDMRTGNNTEEFTLFGDIRAYLPKEPLKDNGADILLDEFYGMEGVVKPGNCINIWGGRSNGEDSHIYLLAIACLIADRLPEAAMVSGSISAGQCRRAVRWANQHLASPVRPPVIACRNRLLKHLKNSSLPENQILEGFYALTVEAKDKGMGDFLRKEFKEEEFLAYYKKRFLQFEIGQRGFVFVMKEYLEMGFAFKGLCDLVVSAPDGMQAQPEEFLKRVVDSKLYIKDKETGDLTKFAEEKGDSEEADTVKGIIAKTLGLLCGADNQNVNAFYPLEKIKSDCRKAFGDRCRVDDVIDRLTAPDKELSARSRLQKVLYDNADSIFRSELFNGKSAPAGGENSTQEKKYDISTYRELKNFTPGCIVRPELELDLLKNLQMIYYFAETEFKEFQELDREQRENFFINNIRCLLLSKEVWERIFDRIMDDAYIVRFYGIFSVNCLEWGGYNFCTNLLSNLQVFDYYWDKIDKADAELE